MFWRAICFASGVCLGLLGALAVVAPASTEIPRALSPALVVELGAGGGGLVLLALASWIARVRDDDPDRGLHLATSASVGFAALPAAGAALLDLSPGPRAFAAVIAAALAVALVRGARRRGPTRGRAGCFLAAALALAAGGVAVVAATAVGAATAPAAPPPTPEQEAAVFDLDARVATRAVPRCRSKPLGTSVLLASGAHPRMGPEGRFLWFDAATSDGRRQVHRLDRTSGTVVCWSCGEPGNNRRPAPANDGVGLVFDTDRYVSWRDPTNTELQITSGAGEAPGIGSRRLTVSPGPDERAVFGPSPNLVAWTRGEGARLGVVSAVVRSGHGGLVLGRPALLLAGRGRFVAPAAWSPDARSLVVVRGNPLRPLEALSLDLALPASVELGTDAVAGASASHDADGAWLALATSERARLAGLIPQHLGFLVAALDRRGSDAPRFRGTGVRVGEPFGVLAPLDLGDLATWGEPTGVALAPDGERIVLGQRRATPEGRVEERLVEIVLDCATPDGA